MTTSSVSVPVVDDMLAERRNETFDLMLSVPSSLGQSITAGGRDRAIGVIIDTTSECKQVYCRIVISIKLSTTLDI